MSRLRELINELCPDGVEYKSLGDVAEVRSGWGFPNKYQGLSDGIYPFYKVKDMTSSGNERFMRRAANYIMQDVADILRCKPAPPGSIVFPKIGAAIATEKRRILTVESCYDNNVMALIPNTALADGYLALVFSGISLMSFVTGEGAVPSIRKSSVEDYRIPVPPIEVQREIVRILDSFLELDDALTAEIEARERQYHFAQEKCFTKYFGNPAPSKPSTETVMLGDLYDVTSSQRVYQSEQSSNGVPFLRVSDLIAKMDGHPFESRLFITEDMYQNLVDAGNVPHPGDILVTARGTLGRYYFVESDDRFYFQDGMITWLRSTKNSPSHAFFSALFSNELFLDRLIANCGQGTVKYLSIKGLSNTLVPRPDADKLVAFDSEMSQYEQIAQLALDLRCERDARRRQFEHYRDAVLSFMNLVTNDE